MTELKTVTLVVAVVIRTYPQVVTGQCKVNLIIFEENHGWRIVET